MKTFILVILGAAVAAMAVEQFHLRSDLRDTNERLGYLQFEVRTLTHALGEVHQEAITPSDIITNYSIEGGTK